jgi:hypothetical protein
MGQFSLSDAAFQESNARERNDNSGETFYVFVENALR